jgi:sigma-E factor negative regulatory protein RseB
MLKKLNDQFIKIVLDVNYKEFISFIIVIILFSVNIVQPAFSKNSVEQHTVINNSQHSKNIQSLLQQFVRNGDKQLFDGTFVYFFEDQIQTIKVHREKNSQGKVVEQFIPLDSQQKQTSRVLENQYCSLTNNWPYQFQSMSSSFPFRINNYYPQLQQYYHFSLSKIETIAGTPAIGVQIKSKDPYRYGYQLWFEPQTATLLKYKLMDQKDKVIEQYLFTDIQLQADKQDVTIKKPLLSCQQQFKELTQTFQKYFMMNKMIAGYEPISFRKGTIYNTQRQAYQFQLSDGLSSVSIFIEDSAQSTKKINGVIKLGPVNVAGKTIGDYQVTVIGAIPVVTALRFLKAVKISADISYYQ